MIDLHCHLLPSIDDGAWGIDQALDLARLAVKNGIEAMVCTPHIHLGRYENDKKKITQTFDFFRRELIRHSIPLEVGVAAEVRLGSELMEQVERDELPYLGHWQGYDVLLLEMPHSHIPAGTDQLIRWLLNKGVMPMIAHPERNKDVVRDYRTLKPILQTGCLIQVTAGAVAGCFGRMAKQRAEELLRDQVVTILASDAHHISRRPPELEPGRQAAEAIIGESASWDLVRANPQIIAECHFETSSV